ncbi:signal peptidase I [Streptomyces sp. 549]|uniref:signal peptidase I n=1 Tax=Streptomyces sp. 549 TaxID=3049076 RepID=UPI0024C3378B|nr:signal peptidase I [Streptomyces sp. 549]MDK1475107.1 signal peptidase I [Streptomyces sp. 549]
MGEVAGTASVRRRGGEIVSSVLVALGCVLFLGGSAWGALQYRPYTVPTDSMAPTVAAGERVLAQRIDGDRVRRGDVVVFTDPQWGDLPMVKRVVAVGGDEVDCCDARGRLTVNGQAVEEPYLSGGGPASTGGFRAQVPDGRLFLLGDSREVSLDSRVHLADGTDGAVPRSGVRARVDATAWPPAGLRTVPRPEGFAQLPGGVSRPGPLVPLLWAVGTGALLILGGAAYGPIARRVGRGPAS